MAAAASYTITALWELKIHEEDKEKNLFPLTAWTWFAPAAAASTSIASLATKSNKKREETKKAAAFFSCATGEREREREREKAYQGSDSLGSGKKGIERARNLFGNEQLGSEALPSLDRFVRSKMWVDEEEKNSRATFLSQTFDRP